MNPTLQGNEAHEDLVNRALLLLKKPVRMASSSHWLRAWRGLANVTSGITGEDPRFQSVMTALAACDDPYLANDWAAFQLAADRVKQIAKGQAA